MKIISEFRASLYGLLLLNLLLILGLLGQLNSVYFNIIFILHLLLLLVSVADSLKLIFSEIKKASFLLKSLVAISFVLSLYSSLPSLILPVSARDSLIHHLAIPKFWIERGSIFQINWHEWSYYPMLIQLAFTGLLKIGPEQLCNLYVFLFLPLFTAVTLKFLKLFSDKSEIAAFSVILSLSTAEILKLASIPMVDLPLAYLCCLSLLLLAENSLYAGLALGLALSTKLNAIPFVFFAALSFFIGKTQEFKIVAKRIGIICCIALLTFSPWLIKNYIWTANPLYPYLSSIFESHIEKPVSGLKGLNPLQQRLMLYNESAFEVLLLPLRIFYEGQDNNPRLFDGVLSPLFLLGQIFGLLFFKEPKIKALFLVSFSFTGFSLLSTAARVRYLAPIFGVFIILTCLALKKLSATSKAGSLLIKLSLCIQVFLTFNLLYPNKTLSHALDYLNSSLSRQDYLEIKVPEYPAINYINNNLKQDAKVYLIYTGNQFYLYKRNVFSSGHTSADHLLVWISESHNALELREKILQSGITNLFLNEERLFQVLQTKLTYEEKQIWNIFFNQYLEPKFSARGFSVFELK